MCHETWSLDALKARLCDVADESVLLKEKIESSFINAYYLRPKLEASNELAQKLMSLIAMRYKMSVMLETYGISYFGDSV
jgi:hypothetical protein